MPRRQQTQKTFRANGTSQAVVADGYYNDDDAVVCDATVPADYCDCGGDCGGPFCECPDAIACCDVAWGYGDMGEGEGERNLREKERKIY